MKIITLAVFILQLLFLSQVEAGVNKCTDIEGNITYSKKQCVTSNQEQVLEIHKPPKSFKPIWTGRRVNKKDRLPMRIATNELLKLRRQQRLELIAQSQQLRIEQEKTTQKMMEANTRIYEQSERSLRSLNSYRFRR